VGGALLAAQVAFALVLVTGGLRVASGYAATNRIDPGFDVSDTLTMQLTLPRSRYADGTAHVRFAEGVVEQVYGLPGVTAAGVVSDLPFVGNQMHFAVRVEGAGRPPHELQLGVRLADAGYFRTLQVPLISGRYFEASDVKGTSPVALVNRTAAEMLWGGEAVNQHLLVSDDGRRQLVGVVGDIRHAGLHASEGPVVYIPYAQKPFDFVNWIGLVVRGQGIERSSSVVKAAIARVDPNQPAYGVMTMEDYLTRERAPFRLGSLVVGCLAGAAFILAMSGIYGLTSFIVGNRFREFGVRLALGATRAGIVALVLRQIAGMLVLGSLAGVLGVLATSGWLQRTVLAVVGSVSTPSLVGGALALFGASSLAAALAPALRASRTDPRNALQAE
jgi:putative ABC transport system permease protein